jgi:hypothetical protein
MDIEQQAQTTGILYTLPQEFYYGMSPQMAAGQVASQLKLPHVYHSQFGRHQ